MLFNTFAFPFFEVFEGTNGYDAFTGKCKSEYNFRRIAINEMCVSYMMDPESEVVSISRDLYQHS